MMTHGKNDGKIYARDGEFIVQELWEPFIGDACETLIGKPKLFFIQACRGVMTDPGTIYKPKPKKRFMSVSDTVDAKAVQEETFVIPTLADLLVMYSTADGYYSFRNPEEGSWFIQALCEELRLNSHEDLLTILTGVNRRVAFAKQSNIPQDDRFDAMKQMPNINSMLTKIMYFRKKSPKDDALEQNA
jgi:caspase 7